jgi:hypothetical protein
VPSAVECQLLLEFSAAVRNQNQPSCALGFECANAALDHRQAPVFPHGPESVLDSVAPAPPSESLLSELRALVGDKPKGLVACASE